MGGSMEEHYQKILQDTEKRVKKALRVQVLKESDPNYGGFYEPNGIVQAKYSIYRVAPMIAVFCNDESIYYMDDMLHERILMGLAYIERVQHENGLFDYVTCNFYSAPDTAFCIKKLLPVYSYLRYRKRREGLYDEEREILEKVEGIVKKGAEGMLDGGFHTPNHRWAIASVLAECSVLFEDQRMKNAAEEYLREGIDCNESGEFSEKSAGNYNRINDDAMIMLSEALGETVYEEYAVRNLRLMLSYLEADDSIFTADSTRFDKDLVIFPKDYYLDYLRMGIKYDDKDFIGMADRIFDIIDRKKLTAPDILIHFMNEPELRHFESIRMYRSQDFCSFYEKSGIVRGRHEGFTYTIMKGKSDFFYLNNGTMKMMIKLAGSFCEHRAFQGEMLEQTKEGEFHLSQVMQGWYYLPFEEKPPTSDWWKMDNASRKKKLGPDMKIDVWVKEAEHGMDIRFRTQGVDGAPWRVEIAVGGGDFIEGESFCMPLRKDEAIVAKSGMIRVSDGESTLSVGPCFGAHHFTDGKEDSEARVKGAATVYLTDYTSFDRTVEIRTINERN